MSGGAHAEPQRAARLNRQRSPRLNREEWILLLDLYLRRRPHSVAANDPELLEISDRLAQTSRGQASPERQWRSPDGLRARMSVFRVLDPEVETPDTKRAAIGAQVWNEFAHRPSACVAAAADLRARLSPPSGEVIPAIAAPRSGPRSPRLDEDEWTLLLDLFIAAGRRAVPATDTRLKSLSQTMRRRRGADLPPGARGPDGLRREMAVLRILDLGGAARSQKHANAADAVWTRFAADPEALAAQVARIMAALPAPRTASNPAWTEAETLLALDAYLQVRPRYADAGDPLIEQLCDLLRLNAGRRGVRGTQTFRNPAGVARKVNKFRAAEAGLGPEVVKGARLEAQVWRAFITSPGETLIRVTRLKAEILNPVGPNLDVTAPAPSRGPIPSFGQVSHLREDGETLVYLLALSGPVAALYPDSTADRVAIIKVGRTTDLARRLIQLNIGFPPGSGLAWRAIASLEFSSASEAHKVEQALLDQLYARGLTLGGEYARLPVTELSTFLSRRPPLRDGDPPQGASC